MKVGIVGGGQLARMLVLAGVPLGLEFRVLDPSAEACAAQVARSIRGDYDDPEPLARLSDGADCVTFDFENVPAEAARYLERRVATFPPSGALEVAQDRLKEKLFFRSLDIPTPAFEALDSLHGLHAAAARIGLPAMLKTRRLGYDGKGQKLLRRREDLDHAWEALGGVPLILEALVEFEKEVSVLALRSRSGETAFYPLVENTHRGGILRVSEAPCGAPALERLALDQAGRILERLGYVGLLSVEFFVRDGRPIANEMAPRVHNSGHWTIEGAETSQFENHLRAVLGLPLGSTAARGHSLMLNCIGALPAPETVLAVPGAHLHAYGKAARPGRKLGHITLRAEEPESLRVRAGGLAGLPGL